MRFMVFHMLVGLTLISLAFYFGANRGLLGGGGAVIVEEVPVGEVPFRPATAPLTFTDQDGNRVEAGQFLGRHQLIFFGYTHCPDVCPSNLAVMSEALELMGDEADKVQPLFITFDPKRDTPEVMKRYVGHFHPRLIGLTGTEDEIRNAARIYGVFYQITPSESGDAEDYLIEHSSQTYLVGPDGRGVALFGHDSDPSEMAKQILDELRKTPGGVAKGGS